MKLIKFNSETLPKTHRYSKDLLPTISIGKRGIFSINKAAVELLKFNSENKYAIAQDPDEPKNWYVYKDKNGFKISQRTFKINGTADFYHKSLQNSFCEAMGLNPTKSHRFLIAGIATVLKGDTTEYFGILIP